MENYQDQARAIWSALDKMLEQDPEGYKQFVTEQLQEGTKLMKKETRSKNSTEDKIQINELGKAFEKMKLSQDNDGASSPTSEKQDGKEKTPKRSAVKEVSESQKGNCEDGGAIRLLDDEIGGSILTQIVKDSSKKYGEDSGDEDGIKLNPLDIKGPGAQMKKRLIEEL